MKLVLVISSLSSGGAERVLVLLARGLAQRGHQVTVVTIYGEDSDFFRLPPGVNRVALGVGKDTGGLVAKLSANGRRLRALRRAIREARPDAVISLLGQTNGRALLATSGRRVPGVVSEHTDPRREPLPGAWQSLRRIAYRRAAKGVSGSADIDSYFDWIAPQRRAVIPNPVDFAELEQQRPGLEWPWPHVAIAMGRLAPEKGFDLLIEAFAGLSDLERFADWGLVILGEGRLRGELESAIARAGLAGRVLLPGAIPSPGNTLKKADLCVLSSRWDCLPMALIEAMACGLPGVATQCAASTAELVRPGQNGVLVPAEDVPALAAAMAGLMENPARRRSFGEHAVASVRPFALGRIVEAWERLLEHPS